MSKVYPNTSLSELSLEAISQISIFSSVLKNPAVGLVIELLGQSGCECANLSTTRAQVFRLLATSAESSEQPLVGDAWQNHLLEAVVMDENIFARKAEMGGAVEVGSALRTQVAADLSTLRLLYSLNLQALLGPSFAQLDGFNPGVQSPVNRERLALKQKLHSSSEWEACIGELASYFASSGAGEFGRFRAFRWVRGAVGCLRGVASPDPIRLCELVEYQWQRESVRRNTQKLLAGLPTNNMLLYGDRGTGKSSTVKAMLNEFPKQRLRLVEVAKEDLIDLPEILSILRKRPEKYILFIDDLSFEENETQYKALKAVLEGGLEARPVNVALYATSNRRNLIRERFSDRANTGDEVHPGDTMQEKLSLSDRFGLKVPFLAPDQEEYLRIVQALIERAGIELTEELRKQALAWQHARSGRSARQFVDYVVGEKALRES